MSWPALGGAQFSAPLPGSLSMLKAGQRPHEGTLRDTQRPRPNTTRTQMDVECTGPRSKIPSPQAPPLAV
jgi:hypothetical protein